MENIFVKEIQVNEVRNIKDFRIPLANDKKRNLIITGKNGCGKTSLLRELKIFLTSAIDGRLAQYDSVVESLINSETTKKKLQPNATAQQIQQLDSKIKDHKNWLTQLGGTKIEFNQPLLVHDYFQKGDFIIAFFEEIGRAHV